MVLVGLQLWTTFLIQGLPPGPPPHDLLIPTMLRTQHIFHVLGSLLLAVFTVLDLRGTRRTRRWVGLVALAPILFSTLAWAISSQPIWAHAPADLIVTPGLIGFAVGIVCPAVAIGFAAALSRHRASASTARTEVALAVLVLLWSLAFMATQVLGGIAA